MRLLVFALGLLLLTTACPPPPAPPPPDQDGGVDAGTVVDGCLVAPAPPDPPRLADWTCPSGWLPTAAFEVDAGELALGIPAGPKLCAPPALPPTCPLGSRPALGFADCQPLGDACPSGDFPAVPAGTTALYVKPGATGDGSSPTSPFGTIAQAVAVATTGTTIVLSKGTFTEHVQLNRSGVTLLGACVAQTIVQPPGANSSQATIDVLAGATVRNLQITGPRIGVWVSNTLYPATVKGVLVQGAELAGIFVSDQGKASLTDVLVTGTLPDPADNTMGRGLQVRARGRVTGQGVVVDGNRDVGVTVEGDGSTVDLFDVVIRGTDSELASHLYGGGLEVRYRATATLTRALIEKNRSTGAVAQHAGTSLTLTDAVLQDQRSTEATRRYGTGFEGSAGATATFTRVLVRRNLSTGVILSDPGTTLTATDLAVTDTLPQESDLTEGWGVVLKGSSQATLSRAVVARSHVAGLLVAEPGTHLTLTDARVRDTRGQITGGSRGEGLVVMQSAALDGARVRLERSAGIGCWAQQAAQVTLDDLVVSDASGSSSEPSLGLEAQSTSRLTVHRGRVERVQFAAVQGTGSSVVQLVDFEATDILPDAQGRFGRGLMADSKATVSVTRGHFLRTHEVAVYAISAFTNLTLDTVRIEDTLPAATGLAIGRGLSIEKGAAALASCVSVQRGVEGGVVVVGDAAQLQAAQLYVSDTKDLEGVGDGLCIAYGASATVQDFEVHHCADIGVSVSDGAGTLTRGLIADNPVGLFVGGATSLTSGPAGPTQLSVGDDTHFVGNTARVSSALVPLPKLSPPAPSVADL